MKVTLTFELPEERSDLLLALNAANLASGLSEINHQLRAHTKYGTVLNPEEMRREIRESLEGTEWDI